MKPKGRLLLLLIFAATVVMAYLVCFGIGSDRKLSAESIGRGLDLSGGISILYEAQGEDISKEDMEQLASILRRRVDAAGWLESEVSIEGEDRIRVSIPGVQDPQTVKDEIGKTAHLSFVDEAGNVWLDGNAVSDARFSLEDYDASGVKKPCVVLSFSAEGQALFEKATEENIGKVLYIVMDDEIISSPMVQEKIADGNAVITGLSSQEEAEQLALLIREGALPFDLTVLRMQQVGATLGDVAFQSGVFAGICGVILIMVYMLATYRVLGLTANFALITYIAMNLLAFNIFGITLSLSGIAGFVLSTGMAVDANIVIFERIKEELVGGRTLRAAIRHGFSDATPAILDGNITTLIAAGILYAMCEGTVRGFSETLMIGIVLSGFTSLVISRGIVIGLMEMGLRNPKHYGIRTK